MPRIGARARIGHFGGSWERGTVTDVRDHGRRLVVTGEDGESIVFVLSPATAKWVAEGAGRGARLDLVG